MINLKSYFIKDKKLNKTKSKKLKVKPNKLSKKNKKYTNNKIKLLGVKDETLIKNIKEQAKKIKCDFLKTQKAQYLSEGVKNVVLEGCIDMNCNKKIAIRLMGISNLYKFDKFHPVNVELNLYKKFNKFIDENIFSHVPYLLKSIDCNYEKIFKTIDNLPNNNKKDKLSEVDISMMDKIYFREIKKELKIACLEYCHLGDLGDFVIKYRNKNEYLRNVLFQTVLTIVVSQYHIKDFRHNDLHSSNVLLGNFNFKNEIKYKKLYKEEKNKYFVRYKIFGKYYYLPYLGFCVKMFDFDNATSRGNHNIKLEKELMYIQCGATNLINPIFDYHLIMNSAFNEIHEKGKLNKEFSDFFDEQIEEKYRGKFGPYLGFHRLSNYYKTGDYKDVNLIPDSVANPYDILFEHKIFEQYRNIPDNPNYVIVQTYDTKVPNFNSKQKSKRKDMFK